MEVALGASEARHGEADANPTASPMRGSSIPLPGILFNAIPKSAGSYINNLILRGLGFAHIDITLGIFPDDVLHYGALELFLRGNKVAHHHLDASPINRRYMALYGVRAVIHTRDPRAVLLSWLHHLAPAARPSDLPMLPMIAPPAAYYAKPADWRMDWLIDNHFDIFVGWIAGWVAAESELGMQLRFTSFEEFLRSPWAVVDAILEFYGIASNRLVRVDLPRTAALNFRVGRMDEWRETMSRSQQTRCRARIPDALMHRFAWPE